MRFKTCANFSEYDFDECRDFDNIILLQTLVKEMKILQLLLVLFCFESHPEFDTWQTVGVRLDFTLILSILILQIPVNVAKAVNWIMFIK